MNAKSSVHALGFKSFLRSLSDSTPLSTKPSVSKADSFSPGPSLRLSCQGITQQIGNTFPPQVRREERSPSNDGDMGSRYHRGYRHGESREHATDRSNTRGSYGPGQRDRWEDHLLPPGPASGVSWDAGIGSRHKPSGSVSPASQYAPELVLPNEEHQSEEEEDIDTSASEEEDTIDGTESSKSGAERLVEKRKMKRFRLTHAQTRYLMSEFARHAHPDAGQRERLSRDIPGLSPRQVQVWFQNRRAKLKRLTTDDQERMMRSRALPDNFDFAQTLRPEVRDPLSQSDAATYLANLNLTGVDMHQGHTSILHSDRRNIPSNALASMYTNIAGSATASANQSPVSSINEGSQYSGSQYSQNLSPLTATPRVPSPFGRSNSFSASPQAERRQVKQSRQRSATFKQTSSDFTGTAGPYSDSGLSSASQTPFQPQADPQHALASTQRSNTTQRFSQLASPNTQLYAQRQPAYPQTIARAGYYQNSVCQSAQLNDWSQSVGVLPPANTEWAQPVRISPPTSQPHGVGNPSANTYPHGQMSSYHNPAASGLYTETGQAPFLPPSSDFPRPRMNTHPSVDVSRRRGNTFPSGFTHPR